MTGARDNGDTTGAPPNSTNGVRPGAGRWCRLVPVLYSLVLALLVLGPLLGSGYLLLRDAVSTPRSYATDAALGLGDAAPRAVPQDVLLAALTHVVDGGVVVKAILVLALTAAGWGAARLARALLGVSLAPQLVAATIAIWNPYVGERLLQGHWSLLAGYAALPWTVLAAQRLRIGARRAPADRITATDPAGTSSPPTGAGAPTDSPPAKLPATATGANSTATRSVVAPWASAARTARPWLILGGVLAAAGLTPTGSLLAGLIAVLVVGRRNLLGTVGVWILSASPWLVATALSGGAAEASDPAGVAAFSARAEPGLGTLGSLAGLGGIWNSAAVPGSRTTLFAVLSTAVLLVIVLCGIRAVGAAGDPATRRTRRVLLILAGVAIVLPALGATGWGISTGEFLMEQLPGAGLLRDTQKYVALAMPAFAVCGAAGCRALATVRRDQRETPHPPSGDSTEPFRDSPEPAERETSDGPPGRQALIAAGFMAALLLTLPDLAWGVGGALRPVHYPAGWERVAEKVEGPGDVAVLPAGMFRVFPYSGRVPVLDPAPRMLRSDVLQTGVLPVRGQVVEGEGARAQRVENLLLHGADPDELATQGVGWLLFEHRRPDAIGSAKQTVAQLNPVYSDGDLSLYRIPHVREVAKASPSERGTTLAAHALWALMVVAGIVAAVGGKRPRKM